MEISDLVQKKRDQILQIAAKYGARNVQVFGSIVRGEATAESDLDLLVELDRDRSLLDLIAIKQDLEDILGCPVDVVTKAALSPYIREQILKEAVTL